MEETATAKSPSNAKVPLWLILICLLALPAMILVIVEQFTNIHPLAEKVGWGIFAAANLLMILNAAFRKKQSDLVGEFHAQNLISYLVFFMIAVALLLIVSLFYWVSVKFSNGTFSTDKLYGLTHWLAVISGFCISYGWLRWVFKKR